MKKADKTKTKQEETKTVQTKKKNRGRPRKSSITMQEMFGPSTQTQQPELVWVDDIVQTQTEETPVFTKVNEASIDEYQEIDPAGKRAWEQEQEEAEVIGSKHEEPIPIKKKGCSPCMEKEIQKQLRNQYIFIAISSAGLFTTIYFQKKMEGITKFIIGCSAGLFLGIIIFTVNRIKMLNDYKKELNQQEESK